MNLEKGLICMLKAVLLILLMVSVFAFLYDRGYLVLNSKSAVSYIGSQRGNAARFTSCSGSVKRVVRFREDGVSRFVLDVELSKGDLSVELLDSAKRTVMHLDCANRSASVPLEKKKKYILVVKFKSATGRYALRREQVAADVDS